MENKLPPIGTRVTYSHPLLGVLKGVLVEGGMHDDPVMFMPDEVHHPRLEELGYEPEAGFFTESDGGSASDIRPL